MRRVLLFTALASCILLSRTLKLNNLRSFHLHRLYSSNEDEDLLGFQDGSFKSAFVSILGNPNVGKSTLMNRILGQNLSIVSSKPQTTRHRILGVATEDNYQLIFSDTPGMVAPVYKLQENMMDSVKSAAGDADIVVLVTDVYGEPLIDKDIMGRLSATPRPILIVVNKVDMINNLTEPSPTTNQSLTRRSSGLFTVQKKKTINANADTSQIIQTNSTDTTVEVNDRKNSKGEAVYNVPLSKEKLSEIWKLRLPLAEVIFVSAKENVGTDSLKSRIVSHAPLGPKYFPKDMLTNRDERFFVCEIVRESIFNLYKDEVPYSCEVEIVSFKDKSPKLSVIEANVIVNKDSQKAIIIGKGGSKLKDLGTLAREKLEEFLDRKVFLSLRVKVDEDWRMSDSSLEKYGYKNSDFG